jgi:neutral trehalase
MPRYQLQWVLSWGGKGEGVRRSYLARSQPPVVGSHRFLSRAICTIQGLHVEYSVSMVVRGCISVS